MALTRLFVVQSDPHSTFQVPDSMGFESKVTLEEAAMAGMESSILHEVHKSVVEEHREKDLFSTPPKRPR